MFELFADYLKSTGVEEEQIIRVNLEDITFVFLDEIQNCKGFEKAVDSLFIQPKVDVYITGSNACMLSGKLATLLSGRYITIDMLPFSFKEYCTAINGTKTPPEHFNDYLRFGFFPYVFKLEHTDSVVIPYIEGIYNTILIKDVAKREGITDVSLLENIVKFVASCIGSPISAKKISDAIGAGGRKISVNTVDSYLLTLTREFEPLQKIPDHHPTVLLTLEEIGAGANYDGIKQLNLLDWLLT